MDIFVLSCKIKFAEWNIKTFSGSLVFDVTDLYRKQGKDILYNK